MKATVNLQTVNLQTVKSALLRYAKADRWNRNTSYSMGFNDDAQTVIDLVAEGNYGFASDIATTVKKYNYSISEKQAYWIARTAIEKLNSNMFDSVIFENN